MIQTYKNRIEPILEHIHGDTILDIGCVGMGKNDVLGGVDFMHDKLVKLEIEVVGIDINKIGLKKMSDAGFNVYKRDAQKKYELNKKFDTVISEENIEHISDLGVYLRNVKHHLKKDGIFILTTPNAFCFDFMIQTLLWGAPRVNKFHTHYHSLETITYLLESNGFVVQKTKYFQAITEGMNLNSKILKLFLPLLPRRLGRSILVVAKKNEKL